MENTKYGKRKEGHWTPIRAKALDTRANPNIWETHLVWKRWDIGLLRTLSLWLMMMIWQWKVFTFAHVYQGSKIFHCIILQWVAMYWWVVEKISTWKTKLLRTWKHSEVINFLKSYHKVFKNAYLVTVSLPLFMHCSGNYVTSFALSVNSCLLKRHPFSGWVMLTPFILSTTLRWQWVVGGGWTYSWGNWHSADP